MRRTKIVCTIGPVSRSVEVLERLMRAGMDVARLNFSHGTQAEHAEVIQRIRAVAQKLARPVAILQDLAGPKVRVGEIPHGPVLLKSGDAYTLTARDVPGTDKEVSLVYKNLPNDVRAGDVLLLADGALEMTVESVQGPDIFCRVVVGGPLSSHKGINLPTNTISAPILSDKDQSDLAFGLGLEIFHHETTINAPSTQWWISLSSAIVFGLSFATVLTLIVTPSMLMVFTRAKRRDGENAFREIIPANFLFYYSTNRSENLRRLHSFF